MLRPLAALAAAALVLASCGDDDDGGAAAPPQQGVSGTAAGQPFTAADISALSLSQETCELAGVSASATGLLLGFGTFQGLCTFVTQNQGCANKANATIVTALIVRANVLGGNPGPVGPGTYVVGGSTPLPDAQGNVTIPQALVVRNDATCQDTSGTPTATSGTIQITSAGARIAGTVDLTFEDGGRVTGSFDVPACGFQTDVCTVLAGGGPTCPAQPPCL
jgi:hypothetical protein